METTKQNRKVLGAHLARLEPGDTPQKFEYSRLSSYLGVEVGAVEKEAREFAVLHGCEFRGNPEQGLGYFQRKKNG